MNSKCPSWCPQPTPVLEGQPRWARLIRPVPCALPSSMPLLWPTCKAGRQTLGTGQTWVYTEPISRMLATGPLLYKLLLIQRTNESTGSVFYPQTQQAGVFSGDYQTHCRKDICDKNDEMEPSGPDNSQNGKERRRQCLRGDLGLVFICSLMPSFACITQSSLMVRFFLQIPSPD